MTNQIALEGAELGTMITHFVSNPLYDEPLVLMDNPLALSDPSTSEALVSYFLAKLKTDEQYEFRSVDEQKTVVWELCSDIFEQPNTLVDNSKKIADYLYKSSGQSQIKPGHLTVVYFSNIRFEDELLDAIGIFKSEIKSDFINFDQKEHNFEASFGKGYDLGKLDKSTLILNTDDEAGYTVLCADRATLQLAKFWKEEFLKLNPLSNEFYQTKSFLSTTKDFVTKKLPEDKLASRTDQIDILNKTMDYFKMKDKYRQDEFESEVLQDENVIKSFRAYEPVYQQSTPINEIFDISENAVKKSARVYKSVLKLDKNFHIYIHGDKSLIERGMDVDGRKFYKVYFKEEK